MAPRRRLSDSSDSEDDAQGLLAFVNEKHRKDTTRRRGLRSGNHVHVAQHNQSVRALSPPVVVPDSLKDILSLQMELQRSEFLDHQETNKDQLKKDIKDQSTLEIDKGSTGFLNIDNDDDDIDPQNEEEYQLIQSAEGLLQGAEQQDNEIASVHECEIRIDARIATDCLPTIITPPEIPPDYAGRLPVQLNDPITFKFLVESGMLNDIFSMPPSLPIDSITRHMFRYLFFQLSASHPEYIDCVLSWMRDLKMTQADEPLIPAEMVHTLAQGLGMAANYEPISHVNNGDHQSGKERFDSTRISIILDAIRGYARLSPQVHIESLSAMAKMLGGLGIDIEVGKILNLSIFSCFDAILSRLITVDETTVVLKSLFTLTDKPALQVKLVRLIPPSPTIQLRCCLALSFYLGRLMEHPVDNAHQLQAVLLEQVSKDTKDLSKSDDLNDMNRLRNRLLLVDYSINRIGRTADVTQSDGPFTLLISSLDRLVHSLGDPNNHSPTKSAIKQVVVACVDRIG